VFSLSPYHFVLAGCGAAILIAYWLPRFVARYSPASAALLMIGGLLAFGFWPGMPETFDPTASPGWWKIAAEIAVIISLFGTAIRIDKLADLNVWKPTLRLLIIAMPLCLIALTVAGTAAGLTLGAAILLAAVLVPTDPVLAADVQVGPPLEGGEHPIRFALTSEAGLNDGLAFPFVYLGILILAGDFNMGEWLGIYVVYKIVVGFLIGAVAGWAISKLLFEFPRDNALADQGLGVLALAAIFATYGLAEIAEGYGFISVFIMGLVMRQIESQHEYHKQLHHFSESIEQSITALMLILLGATLPVMWEYITWPMMLIGLMLIFILRPAAGAISLIGHDAPWREKAVISFYGVRGVGSIFYLAYAATQTQISGIGVLWATVAFTILVSTIMHGFTAPAIVSNATDGES